MFFKYILLLTLAIASTGILVISPNLGANKDCAKKQFKCDNGECIPGEKGCDGDQYCDDASDELNCSSCTGSAFRCGNGECINKGSLCDLYDDCEDGSDENNCTNRVCGSDEFRCHSGQCIDKSGRCNAWNGCADKSDEENCLKCFEVSKDSTENPFKCVSNNKCIDRQKLCNSINDCPDGSDEDQSTCQSLQCANDEVRCEAGHCVRSVEICIDFDPCGDSHKTEKPYFNCTKCPPFMFKCDAGSKCIEDESLCDTVPDCEDGSDESKSFCSVRKCGSNKFQCDSGQCVDIFKSQTVVCDGHYDCKDYSDKSDAKHCTTCSPEAFKCGSGECVHKFQLCNSEADCFDGSDENEINCPQGSTPPVQTSFWRKTWSTHVPNGTLQHLTENMAVYFDSSVSPSVTWPFFPLSQGWNYAKKTFELERLYTRKLQFLYVVLGKRKHNYEYKFSSRPWKSGYRNIIDIGLRERNGWADQNSANFEKLIFGLGNIVKIMAEGVENGADYKLCDMHLRNTVFYDIYIHLKGQGSADVLRWRATQFNQTLKLGRYNCFRDWFLPIYKKYGGAAVLKNYFKIFERNWPK